MGILNIIILSISILGLGWAGYSAYTLYKNHQKEKILVTEIVDTIHSMRKEIDDLKKNIR